MFHVVIPARYAATRLPGKPLLPIAGRPLVQWVWECATRSGAASVVVATDDERIAAAAREFGADCVLTSLEHASGTDRVAEVARLRGFGPLERVVNLQGDEPMMPPTVIAEVAAALDRHPTAAMATAVAPVTSLEEFLDPGCVKALKDGAGRALYFSRAPVPWPRDEAPGGQPNRFGGAWRHIGIYGYRVQSLLDFAALRPTALELTEKLEQLRALEHGWHIQMVELQRAPPPGVDTAADLERVREALDGVAMHPS